MKIDTAPVKRSNLSDDLTERLMQVIRSESYQPGDRLPPIMEMARYFGVGHPTLREALRKLEVIGIVEIKHGSGVYIKRDQEILLVSNPVFGGAVSKKLLLDLIEARMPIEVKAVALAAQNATDAQLELMTARLERAQKNLDNDEVLSPTNLAFHCDIAEASGNTVMTQLLEVLMDLFKGEHRMILNIYGDRQKDHKEHLSILDALRRRDAMLAAQLMQTHLEGVREVLLRWDPKRNPLS
jgi:GntR family transcriptional repressor for pyruvate dehydrogenase complex